MQPPQTVDVERRRLQVFSSLLVLVFLVNFGRIVFAPLLDPFIRTFGVGEATVGMVATLAWMGSAVPRLPTGWLLTRFSRQRVILGTGLLLAGAASFTALAQSIWHIGLGAFLLGSSSGIYFIAANSLVSELFPDRVGRVIGIHGTASQVAAVVAPFLVAAAIAIYNWRLLFVGMAIAALLGTGWLVYTARRTELPDVGRGDRHLLRSVRNHWPIVLTAVAIIGATGFVWNGFFNFFVRYLVTTKSLSTGMAGAMLTLIFAAGVPAFFYAGRLADRLPQVSLMLGIITWFVGSLLVMTAVQGLLAITVATIALGLGMHSLLPVIDTYLLSSLPDADRSSAYAAYSATMMVIQASASVVVGTLIEAGYGFDQVYRSFSVVLVVVVVLLLGLHVTDRLPEGTT
ncbi:MFS transporter [Halodesulfurarchaeum formicicum]|uniref:Major facilitator superfamily MFS_1 n=1 Tax=Halodesulfurarchaeum formicicum TaxID=1873524 RepID=A0A1J1ACV3_9EURY|nr:MFS transporter [Halodesulfurarchaeum formicicum]APE95974.1 major facilitator superfamily MFS_1 [Halodesulfurarchaeum formicicum]